MQHFLYFRPLPQGQGSLRPTGFVLVVIYAKMNCDRLQPV
jgi:hypothetical protein